MKSKILKPLIIYFAFAYPIMLICLILWIPNSVSITYSGFAVDSSGVLYVGKEGVIEKYNNGKKIGEISPQTSRGYAFTIKENDIILLSTADMVYELDLSGKVLEKWEDEGTKTFNELQYIRKFVARDGRQYVMKTRLGRTMVLSGDKVVYKMPVPDYIVRILLWLCIVSAVVFIPIIVLRGIKSQKSNPLSITDLDNKTKDLFIEYMNCFKYCGEFLLELSDEEIGNYIFEEFDISATTFLHENTLDRLIEAELINKAEYEKSQELRRKFMALDGTPLWNVESVKTAEEWREIMRLCDEIYDSVQDEYKQWL